MAVEPTTIREQFLQVYDTCSDAVFRHCFFRLNNRERARDLMQEAFMRSWTYLSNGNDVRNLRALVYRIANNLIVDEVRKKKEASLEAMEEDGFTPSDGNGRENVEFSIDAKEARQIVDKLDPKYRDVIVMRYLDALSPKEIAEALNLSQTVVSVRIHRGLRKLRTLLAAKEEPELHSNEQPI